MKVIVAGALGFVGKTLVDFLIKKDYEIIVLLKEEREIPCRWKCSVRTLVCLPEQVSDLQHICSERDIDIFFQFAWHGTVGQLRADYDVQLANVKYCCDSVVGAAGLGCKRFVYAGSIMEYEAMQYVIEQGIAPGLANIYSTSKLSASFMTKILANNTDMEYISVIISNIFGAGEKSARFLNTIVRKMMCGEDVDMTHGEQLYDFIYITDAVEQIIIAAQKGKKNYSYYIGSGSPRPLKEFVMEAKNVLKSKSKINFGAVEFNGARLSYEEFDKDSVVKLGYESKISFSQGIINLKNAIEKENRDGK